MSISFITGKPGGGKGLLAMQMHVDELRAGNQTRPIITSLPVKVEPWVNGRWQPMIGLRAYLDREWKQDFNLDRRIFLLNDEQAAEFFLYRVLDGKLVKADATYKQVGTGERRLMEYDTKLAAESGPVLYCIDEAWKFWGSRNWQRTGEAMLFYGAQHRHFGDDVLIVTQQTKQIDTAIQRVAQDFWVVKNHGKMTFGMFRQPAVFSVSIYDQAPTGGTLTPMSRKLFKLDKGGLAQCYDTSAGVGLSGRMVADVGAKAKGLPWWFMLVIVFGGLTLLWGGLRLAGHVVTRKMVKTGGVVARGIEKGLGGSAAGGSIPGENIGRFVPGANDDKTNFDESEAKKVWCDGYALRPKGVTVFLSDGTIASSEDGEVGWIYKKKVRVEGKDYEIRKRPPAVVVEKSAGGYGGMGAVNQVDGADRVSSPGVTIIQRFERPNVEIR